MGRGSAAMRESRPGGRSELLGDITAVTGNTGAAACGRWRGSAVRTAQQLLLSAPITVLSGMQQRTFVKRDSAASRMRGSHAGAR
jgi:hypothetical protein